MFELNIGVRVLSGGNVKLTQQERQEIVGQSKDWKVVCVDGGSWAVGDDG